MNRQSNVDGSSSVTRRGGRGPKIERIADRYGLEGLGDELVDRWLGDGFESQSLRELADLVNRRLIEAALSAAGTHVLDGEVENFYRLLTDDDVTSGMRTDARNSLERKGVDVDQLESDIVSYQSVYNYLTRHRDVSKPADGADESSAGADVESVNKLKSRLRTVLSGIVDKWVRRGAVSIDDYDVEVDVRITCPRCDVRMTPAELYEAGGCDCQRAGER